MNVTDPALHPTVTILDYEEVRQGDMTSRHQHHHRNIIFQSLLNMNMNSESTNCCLFNLSIKVFDWEMKRNTRNDALNYCLQMSRSSMHISAWIPQLLLQCKSG